MFSIPVDHCEITIYTQNETLTDVDLSVIPFFTGRRLLST